MMHRLAICLAIASLTFMSPRPATAATITTFFDSVDAVETDPGGSSSFGQALKITGVLVGATGPTTQTFTFYNSARIEDQVRRCERLALLAMSKPGKYRFGIAASTYDFSENGCKLMLRTP